MQLGHNHPQNGTLFGRMVLEERAGEAIEAWTRSTGHLDPMESTAVATACEISERECCYLSVRFGAPGPLLSASMALLAALRRDSDPAYVRQLLHDLATSLSNRGIPRHVLENHLRTLVKEMRMARCGDEALYWQLDRAVEALWVERQEVLPEEHRAALFCDFFAEVPPSDHNRMVAWLVTAAVVDEACGIPRAVPALTRWFADTSQYSLSWLTAVEHLVRATQIEISIVRQIGHKYRSEAG
ncbi:MAG: hypothetical protein MJE77_35435 [Proteobacteria bacterium]|nr:hypothetical protein [Pseudomonadota bacterium]